MTAAFADTPFAETLITNAGGNPLFLEETVRMLREEGLLELERWQSDEMRDVPIPTSVQGLISSRLDRLEPKEKQLAHHASVIGAIFWAGAVARLGAADDAAPEDPGPGLSELERRDFVAHLKVSTVQDDEEYAFNHILMRDVAYGQVPKGLRAQLHLGFTEWVKDLPDRRGRVRGDRRVAPRAGVPARTRGHAKPDRTADPGGSGHARRGGRPRRAPREPA